MTFARGLFIGIYAGFGWRCLIGAKNALEISLQYNWSKQPMTAHLGGAWEGTQQELDISRQRVQLNVNYYFRLK